MLDRKIDKADWGRYFEVMTRHLLGRFTELEVAGLDLGDQIEDEWITLQGMGYDHKDDAFYVYTAAVTHRIEHPRDIFAVEQGPAVTAVGIRDADGRMQIVKLRTPLMLRAAEVESHP